MKTTAKIVGGVLLIAVILIAFGGISKIRQVESRMMASNNIRNIALAFHGYHDNAKRLPYQAMGRRSSEVDRNLSWRVGLEVFLCSMMDQSIFVKVKWNEPWDSEENRQFLGDMYPFYLDGTRPKAPLGHTPFQVIAGKGMIFDGDTKWTLADITDGQANTILVASATKPIAWLRPRDLDYQEEGPLPEMENPASVGEYFFATVDGAAHFLHHPGDAVLRALITPQGNEKFDIRDKPLD